MLSVPGLSKVAVGDPSVASVKAIGGNQVMVVGAQDGRTTLIIWKESGQRLIYNVVVRKLDPGEVVTEIRAPARRSRRDHRQVVGDHVYLDGVAYTQEDFDRVQSMPRSIPTSGAS